MERMGHSVSVVIGVSWIFHTWCVFTWHDTKCWQCENPCTFSLTAAFKGTVQPKMHFQTSRTFFPFVKNIRWIFLKCYFIVYFKRKWAGKLWSDKKVQSQWCFWLFFFVLELGSTSHNSISSCGTKWPVNWINFSAILTSYCLLWYIRMFFLSLIYFMSSLDIKHMEPKRERDGWDQTFHRS